MCTFEVSNKQILEIMRPLTKTQKAKFLKMHALLVRDMNKKQNNNNK